MNTSEQRGFDTTRRSMSSVDTDRESTLQQQSALLQAKASQRSRAGQAADVRRAVALQRAGGSEDTAAVHEVAAHGISGSGGALPYVDAIQRSFGHHDVSGVRAHVGGKATEASAAMGAQAYATGNDVAFGQSPNLHTVAHEAAHILQQRAGVSLKGGVGQVGDPYEHHADAVADRVVQGKSAVDLLDQMAGERAGGVPAEGEVQRFQISGAQQTTYPKFTTFVADQMPKTANDPRIRAAMQQYGTNTGPTAKDPAQDVAWGAGPTISVTPSIPGNGQFTPGINSQELRLQQTIITAYEAETDASKLPAHEMLMESTILHEYTHYLDDQDGHDHAGEEGQAFEEQVYGQDVDTVAQAESVLNPEFGEGDWTLTVETKIASYEQRFIVSGATSGGGTYEGIVGKSANVKADPGVTWSVKIEHNDGKNGWKESTMHKVREGTDDFLVRSEDWTDRDMDDLELRVKK